MFCASREFNKPSPSYKALHRSLNFKHYIITHFNKILVNKKTKDVIKITEKICTLCTIIAKLSPTERFSPSIRTAKTTEASKTPTPPGEDGTAVLNATKHKLRKPKISGFSNFK